jgi:outer membrane protein assembly factor BamB
MRRISSWSIALPILVAAACTGAPAGVTPSAATSPILGAPRPAVALRLAAAPPVVAPDGSLRFVTTPSNELRAEDVATGTVRWTVSARIPASAPTMRWRIVVSDDGGSVYVQSLSDEQDLTYLGTQRIDARTGVELANDIKYEIYWYQNVVLWTAFTQGKLQMAIERPPAGGGGYWLRTLDPLTLKMLTSVPVATRPATPGP